LRTTTQLHRKVSQIEGPTHAKLPGRAPGICLGEEAARRLGRGKEEHRPVDGPKKSARNQMSSGSKIRQGLKQAARCSGRQPAMPAKMPGNNVACYIRDPSSYSNNPTIKFQKRPSENQHFDRPLH
jgi:hypothetical protein